MGEQGMVDRKGYVLRNNRLLRTGHTTGTCAAAAAKAAMIMLFSQKHLNSVEIITPGGMRLTLPVEDISISDSDASCAIRKDGGDDVDVTHGALIYATVRLSDCQGVLIEGGRGVGKVTKNGLDQPPGNAAINTVPRRMITEAVLEVCRSFGHRGGASVTISVPCGEEMAKKTFNPRLGIIGGISIIGTSGIVVPMSEAALVDTIRAEMRVKLASGYDYLLVVPGNYGAQYAKRYPGLSDEDAIRCSNYVGETIDMAVELGAKGLLLFGDLGKLVKLAGGIMNTHSRNADCRMEIISASALQAGANAATARRILGCISTDEALNVLDGVGLQDGTITRLLDRMKFYMEYRAGGRLELGAAVFSSRQGFLGLTEGAAELVGKVSEVVTS